MFITRPLVNCGALLFRDTNLYGFGVPGAGPFLVTCEKGRKELLRLVKECPFQQIPLEVRVRGARALAVHSCSVLLNTATISDFYFVFSLP